jgi:pseudouridine synthase
MIERLQKIIAAAGIASRRAAEKMILDGEVTVNGTLVTQPGAKADPQADHIKVRGKLINPRLKRSATRHILLNKPKGYLSSLSDPQGRPLLTHLIPSSARRGLHPVGRLDFNTEGLIILTNDGDLTRLLTEAGRVEKVYHAKVKGMPGEKQIERLTRGVAIDGKRTARTEIKLISKTKEGNAWLEIKLKQGKNQQIRKMFELIGHSVVKLRRVRIGHLDNRGLAPGQHRVLSAAEVNRFYAKPNTSPAALKQAGRIPSRSRDRRRVPIQHKGSDPT